MPINSGERKTHLQVVAAQSARTTAEERLLPALELAFAPLHKAAFGVATGVAGALGMMLVTVYVLVVPRAQDFPLELMATYFSGYEVSWTGALIGGAWGFLVGFVSGWFVAFCRNMALAVTAFSIRTRAELDQTREFLDHI
ncbi:MAG: hypothetical protein IT359_03010 [Gemmatimonadaceae bacterium]|nr:hypothetical protein [Gemmatimonadaceae bacterium]